MSKEALIKQTKITEAQQEFVPPGEGPAKMARRCIAVMRMDPFGEMWADRIVINEARDSAAKTEEGILSYNTGIGVLVEVNQGRVLGVRR